MAYCCVPKALLLGRRRTQLSERRIRAARLQGEQSLFLPILRGVRAKVIAVSRCCRAHPAMTSSVRKRKDGRDRPPAPRCAKRDVFVSSLSITGRRPNANYGEAVGITR